MGSDNDLFGAKPLSGPVLPYCLLDFGKNKESSVKVQPGQKWRPFCLRPYILISHPQIMHLLYLLRVGLSQFPHIVTWLRNYHRVSSANDANHLINFLEHIAWIQGVLLVNQRKSVGGNRPYIPHTRGSMRARFMGPTWGPSGADRTQVGPMLAPWTLLSGFFSEDIMLI